MCGMIAAIAGAAVSIASSVVSFQAANEDYEARSKQWQQNYANALASGRDEQKAIQLRMVQEQDALTQKRHMNEIEGAEISAEAEVSAANSGLSGVSLGNILHGIRRKVAMKNDADLTNYRNTAAQLTASLNATNTNIENRINSVQRPTAPNPLGYALQGIGGAIAKF